VPLAQSPAWGHPAQVRVGAALLLVGRLP
jgi:hypothetical protein